MISEFIVLGPRYPQEDDQHHHQGGRLRRPEGGRQQAHPRLDCQRHHEGLPGHLPPAGRVHSEGEGDEEAPVRPQQAPRHARREGSGKVGLSFIDQYINPILK